MIENQTHEFNRGRSTIRLTYHQADRLWYVHREDNGNMRRGSRQVHNIGGNALADFQDRVRKITAKAKKKGRI